MPFRHLFGPVPSRRLGISLGIDLVPFKTCSYDCVYCECGPTTDLTVERKEWVPAEAVISEIDNYLSTGPDLDYCTYSGSGEPTLHSGIDRITAHIKRRYPDYRIAVLTNGSLFWDPAVRARMRGIDLIVPSLDAATAATFSRINRPHSSLKIDKIIWGLSDLRRESDAEIWLEVFIVPGLNDSDEEISALNSAINAIDPHLVQLNTLDRPGTEEWVTSAPAATLERVIEALDHPRVECVNESAGIERTVPLLSNEISENIMDLVSRRPCTTEDISVTLGLRRAEVIKYLRDLVNSGYLIETGGKRGRYYQPARRVDDRPE
ncbi:MAG: radical SAM protein [Methanoculleaceae archaeon]